jgi:hypothetical protein
MTLAKRNSRLPTQNTNYAQDAMDLREEVKPM